MKELFNNQRGVAHLILLVLLVLGLVAAVYLVTQTQIFKPRASSFPIVIKSATGATLPQNASLGSYQTSSATVTIELNSPFGLSGVSSPNTGTVSYKFSETPDGLASASATPYTKAPTTFVYTFKNTALGNKYAWVEFLSKDGKTSRASATVNVTNPAGAVSAGFGQSRRFTGTTTDPQYMFVANDADLNPTNALTVEAWIKPNAGALKEGMIVAKAKKNAAGYNELQYYMGTREGGTMIFCINLSAPANEMDCAQRSLSNSTSINGWYHIAMVYGISPYGDTRFNNFINGVGFGHWKTRDVSPLINITNPGDLFIGGVPKLQQRVDAFSGASTFNGEIDEVRISNTSRYFGDFSAPATPFTPDVNTGALFHLDGGGQDAAGKVAGLKPIGAGSYTKSTVPYSPSASPATTPTPSIMPSPFASPSPSPSPSPAAAKRVFVTSATYNGNLGGITGADAKCQERANAVNLGGTWKAWLSSSDPNSSPALRHNHATVPYKLLNGTVIANDWEDLVNIHPPVGDYIRNPINLTEIGTTLGNTGNINVWTNTSVNGYLTTSTNAYTCVDWVWGNNGAQAYAGMTSVNGTNPKQFWTYLGTRTSCDGNLRLYCFEQ